MTSICKKCYRCYKNEILSIIIFYVVNGYKVVIIKLVLFSNHFFTNTNVSSMKSDYL